MKTVVLYCFHKYSARVKQFIQTGIFKDPNVDFIIICNHPTLKVRVPSYVQYINRENNGYDFGAWSDVVLDHDLVNKYDHFIFVNSSVSGPYTDKKWTDIFLKGLQGNIKLYGCTINAMSKYYLSEDPMYRSHVQSYLFCMDKKTLAFLIEKGIFSKTYVKTFNNAIVYKEVLMSRYIIEKGWNIGSILPYYQGVDFTFKTKKLKKYAQFLSNIMTPKYENKLWTKEQLIFVKGNSIQCKEDCKHTKTKRKKITIIVPKTIRLPNYLK